MEHILVSNKHNTYTLVQFNYVDPSTGETRTLNGVIGGFARSESGSYEYEVYVPAEDADFDVEEDELTPKGRVSPTEYRLIIEQKELFPTRLYDSAKTGDDPTSPIQFNRYGALRGLASLASVLALLSIIGSVIGVVAGLAATGNSLIGGMGWVIVLFSIFGGAISYFAFQVAAESIHVLLDMESNTRESADFLRQAVALLDERLGSK